MPKKFRNTIIYTFVALFLFSGLVIAVLAVFLHRGIFVEHLSWNRFQLEDCHIVWENKIRLSIGTINILPDDLEKLSSPGVTDIRDYLVSGKYVGGLIEEIGVAHLTYNNFSAALKLKGWSDESPGLLHLTTDDITLDMTIQPEGSDFVLGFNELSSSTYLTFITGRARITDEALITGELQANIAGKLPLILTIEADDTGLSFVSNQPVTIGSIKPVVDLFKLSPDITPWITEYLRGSSYQLTHLEGMLLWNDPTSFLENVYARVRVMDCEYTFKQGLEPIKSDYTDVVFQKGVLNIYPHDARFHEQDCEKSWVKIDFTEPTAPILTIYIDTHAAVNDDIINLLSQYKITLPFKQLKGKTFADLVLEINLSNKKVDITATFKIDQGVIEHQGLRFDVSDCVVFLKNSEITIQRAEVRYSEVFTAQLSGHIALNKRYGDIAFIVVDSRFKAGDSEIILHNGSEKLSYTYHIRPEGDSFESTASTWQLDSGYFHLAPFTAPVNLQSQILSLPPTLLKTTQGQSESYLSGDIHLINRNADLLVDFRSFKHGNLELAQPPWKLRIQINDGLKIETQQTSTWRLQNIDTTLSPIEIHYKNDEITIENGNLTYGDFFSGNMQGTFNYNSRKGSFFFSKLHVTNDAMGTLFRDYDGFEVMISGDDKGTTLDIPLLDARIDSGEDSGWHVTFRDLEKLADRLPFLNRYHFNNGTLSLSSKNGKRPYHFKGAISYPYAVLVVNDSPVNHYFFSGTIDEEKISAEVLNKLDVVIGEKISITSDNIEYNIVELTELLRNLSKIPRNSSSNPSSKQLELIARQSSLYFRPDSRALADKLLLRVEEGKAALWLEYESGKAAFVAEDGEFTLEGENLNDSFMEGLLAGSNFSGGTLSLTSSGNANSFDARFKVQDTILEDYSVVNNVLTFINTIPALVTFSVPGYNKEGLAVESAFLDLTYDDKLYTLKSLDFNGSQLTMRGAGNASISEDTVNLKLNLITEGRKDLSKIPLIGYVLVGDEKVPSITLEVTGKLSDPDIQNSAFEEVVTLPFDIGLRILGSPFRWIKNLSSEEASIEPDNNLPE